MARSCNYIFSSSSLAIVLLVLLSCVFLISQARTKAGPGSSPPAKANTSDESFGTKKARSSFGRGFFKLRGGKQTASSPNLGDNELLIALLV